MGVPVKVVLDVPPVIVAGLESGALVRVGGVVRSTTTGKIVKHLREVRLSRQGGQWRRQCHAARMWLDEREDCGRCLCRWVGSAGR